MKGMPVPLKIIIHSTVGGINRFVRALEDTLKDRHVEDRVVGLDAEWNVELARHGIRQKIGKLALLILAYKDDQGRVRAGLLRLHKFSELPDSLLKFLVGDTTFVGNCVGGDISKLGKDYSCVEQMKKVKRVNLGGFAKARDVVQNGTVRLDVLVKICLNEKMSKQAEIRISNKWQKRDLSQEQMQYAALDGIKSLEVYFYLRDKPDLTKRLSEAEATVGLSVDIAPYRYGTSAGIVATRCGVGRLTDRSHQDCPVPDGARLQLHALRKRKYKVVEVSQVTAPHFVVPYVKKEDGEAVCLGDFGSTPFFVIFPLTMLKQHIDSPDIRTFPNLHEPIATVGPTPPAPVLAENSTGRGCTTRAQQAEINAAAGQEAAAADMDGEDDLEDDDTNMNNAVLDEIDREADNAVLEFSAEDFATLRKVSILGDDAASGKNLLLCPHLDPPPDQIQDKFSVVVSDPWHGIDRIKVGRRHCAKKMYKVGWREALLQFDPILLARVRSQVKEQDNKTDKELDEDMYFNAAFWKQCVNRRVLPPRLLYWRVRAVFVAYGNIIDPKSGLPLFNAAAWKKANNILKEILLGHFSDPPGYSFYKTKLNKKGEPMVNKYGFEKLSCNRGTPDVENTHKQMVTTFGTWHCGIEMSDCLLRERRHRHNHRCSENRRSGFPRIGHYDTWMIDQYQLLVQANHGIILYPHWVNASDYKNTPETFGTIALHDEELANKLAALEVGPDVKLTHDMKYLCTVMGTKLPFLPVHTVEERRLYRRLILEGINDEKQQALKWVESVNGIDIFPKLPVHLRNYRERFEQNGRARQAFQDARTSRDTLVSLNAALSGVEHSNEDGSNEEAVPCLNDYTRRWEPIGEPQPLQPPPPAAFEARNVPVGGMVIDKNPDVIVMEGLGFRKRRRGKDHPSRKRGIRRCMLCVGQGISDSDARRCIGTNKRSRCPYFVPPAT